MSNELRAARDVQQGSVSGDFETLSQDHFYFLQLDSRRSFLHSLHALQKLKLFG